MDNKNNVIDLTAYLKNGRESTTSNELPQKSPVAANVVDMTERRMDVLRQDRRNVRRTILSEFVGAFVVIPDRGLCKVALYDISENGLAFDLEFKDGQFRVSEELAMRIYLQQSTYFPFLVQVTNVREIMDEGVFRFGVSFVKGSINDDALHHFVKFIENVSASLRKDSGDVMVSGLRR